MSLATLLDCLAASLAWVARASWQASVVAALVLLAQFLLRGRVSARWRYNLWLLVVARLVLPSMPGTRFSPFNWLHFNAAQVAASPETSRTPVARVTPAPRVQPFTVGAMSAGTEPPREQAVAAENLPIMSDDASMEVEAGESAVAPVAGSIAGAAAGAGPSRAVDSPSPKSPSPKPSATTPASVIPSQFKAVSRPMISFRHALAAVWCLGFLVMVARVLWATRRLALLVRNLPEVRDPEIIGAVSQCAARLRLARSPTVLEAPAGIGPALAGVLWPRLLLPAAALRGLGRNELRLVVLHELVHLRRGDLALNWLLAVLEGAHWFNPFVWFAFARLRADRELACDERVLSISPPAHRGDDCRDYGRAILKLLNPPPSGTVPALAVGVLDGGGWARKAQLRRRITMIARFDRPAGRWPALGVALSLLVGGVAFTGAVRGQDDPAAKPSDAPGPQAPQAAPRDGDAPAGGGRAPGLDVRPAGGASQAAPRAGESDPASAGAPDAGSDPDAPVGGASPDGAPAIGIPGGASVGGGSPDAGPAGRSSGPAHAGGIAQALSAMSGRGLASGAPSPAGVTPRPGMAGAMMAGLAGGPGFGGGGIGGAPAESPTGRVEDPEAAKADAKTAGLLHKSMAISMLGMPLDEFLRYLSDQTGADIFLDTKALGDQHDAPVTIQVKEPRSAESLLQWGLRSAGGNSLGYEISNGLVIVTTRSELNKSLVTRSYDVGKFAEADIDLPALIQETVAAGSWRSPGGDMGAGGTIGVFNHKLIVTTTEPNQREVAKLLSLLHDEPAAERGQPALPRGPRPGGESPKGAVPRSGADLNPADPRKPGSSPNRAGTDEGPASSIKADQLEVRIDPNVTVTARGDVEVRRMPAGKSGDLRGGAAGTPGHSPTTDPNAPDPGLAPKPF
ncbi:MAG: hypothetical protein JWL69_737 [Phycisphaerales bacterium]|nr:hypothetical protein [Phycisphaerales bacterium]